MSFHRHFTSHSRFGASLDFDERPVLGSSAPRCSLELAAWRTLALAECCVIVLLICALVLRG